MTADKIPVLLTTRDPALWQHWQALEDTGRWAVNRAYNQTDMARWPAQGLVMLDVRCPTLTDWDDPAFHQRLRAARVLVVSAHPSDDEGLRALTAHARGYAHAYAPCTALSSILATLAEGGIWMGPSLLGRLLSGLHQGLPPAPDDWAQPLTQRERIVALHAAQGASNPEIAAALSITERTVRAHLSTIFEKLDVTDRLKLALKVHGASTVASVPSRRAQ